MICKCSEVINFVGGDIFEGGFGAETFLGHHDAIPKGVLLGGNFVEQVFIELVLFLTHSFGFQLLFLYLLQHELLDLLALLLQGFSLQPLLFLVPRHFVLEDPHIVVVHFAVELLPQIPFLHLVP